MGIDLGAIGINDKTQGLTIIGLWLFGVESLKDKFTSNGDIWHPNYFLIGGNRYFYSAQ